MKSTYCRFKDIRFFGGWITIMWKPRLAAWWSTDAAQPDHLNTGFWIFGKKHRRELP